MLDFRRDCHLGLTVETSPGHALMYEEVKVEFGSVWVCSVCRTFVTQARGSLVVDRILAGPVVKTEYWQDLARWWGL